MTDGPVSVNLDRQEVTIGPLRFRRAFNDNSGNTYVEVAADDAIITTGIVVPIDGWAGFYGAAAEAASTIGEYREVTGQANTNQHPVDMCPHTKHGTPRYAEHCASMSCPNYVERCPRHRITRPDVERTCVNDR